MSTPQEDKTPQENRAIEQQAMNPVVTNEKGEVLDDGSTVKGEDSAD